MTKRCVALDRFQYIEQIASRIGRQHQTITYFGLSAEERDELARVTGAAGVDRVVPIGRALDFTPYWDGYSLWTELTRFVTIQ